MIPEEIERARKVVGSDEQEEAEIDYLMKQKEQREQEKK